MTGAPNDHLDQARQRAGLTLGDLWIRYFEAGGGHGAIELDAVLNGALVANPEEHDLIVQVLNERFTQLGAGTPVPYLGDTGEDADGSTVIGGQPQVVPAPRPVSAGEGEDEWLVAALDLEPENEAPGAARRWARQLLHVYRHPELIDAAITGLTELVTNACVHAQTRMTVSMTLHAGTRVRFHVRDHSPFLPIPRHADSRATSGRGLALLAACGHWGVQEHPDGKTVWFEPHQPAQPQQD